MIDIDKLKVIQMAKQNKLNTREDKNEVIDLFNAQLKILDMLKNEYKTCQTLALNLDEAYKLAETIWRVPKQKNDNYPIFKETKHFELFLDFRTKYINKILYKLKLSEPLDTSIKEYSNEINLQICNDLHILHREGLYKDIEHLFLGVTNHKNKLKQTILKIHLKN